MALPGPCNASERSLAPGGLLPLSTPGDARSCLHACVLAVDSSAPARRAAPEAVSGITAAILCMAAAVHKSQEQAERKSRAKSWSKGLSRLLASSAAASGALGSLPAADAAWRRWAVGLRSGDAQCSALLSTAAQAAFALILSCQGRGYTPELLSPLRGALGFLAELLGESKGAACGTRRAPALLAAA